MIPCCSGYSIKKVNLFLNRLKVIEMMLLFSVMVNFKIINYSKLSKSYFQFPHLNWPFAALTKKGLSMFLSNRMVKQDEDMINDVSAINETDNEEERKRKVRANIIKREEATYRVS